MDPQTLQTLEGLKAIGIEVQGYGWGWAGAVAALVGAIRLWRAPSSQGLLAGTIVKRWPQFRWLLWDELPTWATFAVPFVGSLGAGAITVAAGGMSWAAALVGAVGVGITSIVTHHGTKAIGSALTPAMEGVHPSISRSVSLVFPLDPSRIPKEEPTP
jgi:hypothetical protein